jgi:hypothetical protein
VPRRIQLLLRRVGAKHLIACWSRRSPAISGNADERGDRSLNPQNVRSENACFETRQEPQEPVAWNSSALLEAIDTAYGRIENEAYRNCWIHVRSRDEALEECRKLLARAEAGEYLPLLGIPFGVKDNIDVAGMPTKAAYPALRRPRLRIISDLHQGKFPSQVDVRCCPVRSFGETELRAASPAIFSSQQEYSCLALLPPPLPP